jgi:hypothetical protein
MASSIVRDITPNPPRMQNTIDKIKFLLLVITDLILKFHLHTKDDVWDVILYMLRQINEVQFALTSI